MSYLCVNQMQKVGIGPSTVSSATSTMVLDYFILNLILSNLLNIYHPKFKSLFLVYLLFSPDWMEYGKNANYNTVWVPLSEENAALFDETKAWAYIEEHMGIDYGWQNVLTGWLVGWFNTNKLSMLNYPTKIFEHICISIES